MPAMRKRNSNLARHTSMAKRSARMNISVSTTCCARPIRVCRKLNLLWESTRPVAAIVPEDYMIAYMWYALAEKNGYKQSKKNLKELAAKMSAENIAEAKTRAQSWPNLPG